MELQDLIVGELYVFDPDGCFQDVVMYLGPHPGYQRGQTVVEVVGPVIVAASGLGFPREPTSETTWRPWCVHPERLVTVAEFRQCVHAREDSLRAHETIEAEVRALAAAAGVDTQSSNLEDIRECHRYYEMSGEPADHLAFTISGADLLKLLENRAK